MSEPTARAETVKLSPALSAALDAWIGRQAPPHPTRAEAIQRLLGETLGAPDAGSIAGEGLNASNDE